MFDITKIEYTFFVFGRRSFSNLANPKTRFFFFPFASLDETSSNFSVPQFRHKIVNHSIIIWLKLEVSFVDYSNAHKT
ncbi:hypothetical protein CH373_17015 [Leptospira perolatii]|uniref:Uncharacterized protein n=1 Tax=Leptospira perolatii TaxID=2023191 RepID=A0A2M9ZIT8_9LEPT|nr:hypothetical protein CH360_17585 [Leptospira perolatii]PJZ71932.1 hypothetical protein CH373_17015 [Leptospira perolatii]